MIFKLVFIYMLLRTIYVLKDERKVNCSNTTDNIDYFGSLQTTISGRRCLHWNSEKEHSRFILPHDSVNYCRNPNDDRKSRAWCYTVDPHVRWEYCNVPKCSEWPANRGSVLEVSHAKPKDILEVGQYLQSDNGLYKLNITSNREVNLYETVNGTHNKIVWEDTSSSYRDIKFVLTNESLLMSFMPIKNLSENIPLTVHSNSYYALVLKNYGNLELYHEFDKCIWSSNTNKLEIKVWTNYYITFIKVNKPFWFEYKTERTDDTLMFVESSSSENSLVLYDTSRNYTVKLEHEKLTSKPAVLYSEALLHKSFHYIKTFDKKRVYIRNFENNQYLVSKKNNVFLFDSKSEDGEWLLDDIFTRDGVPCMFITHRKSLMNLMGKQISMGKQVSVDYPESISSQKWRFENLNIINLETDLVLSFTETQGGTFTVYLNTRFIDDSKSQKWLIDFLPDLH